MPAPPPGGSRKAKAPLAPRAAPAPTGITFNPVAEVVEVEKRARASVSSQGWVKVKDTNSVCNVKVGQFGLKH